MFSLAKLEGLENKGPATLSRVHSGFEFQVLDIQIKLPRTLKNDQN